MTPTRRLRPVALVGPVGHQYALGPFADDEAAREHLRRFPDNGEMAPRSLAHPAGPAWEAIMLATADPDVRNVVRAAWAALARFNPDRPPGHDIANDDDARVIVEAFRVLTLGVA